jgi:hypothetical protein
MGNSKSKCDEDCMVRNAMHCFEMSVGLQKQFERHVQVIMRDKIYITDIAYLLRFYPSVQTNV